MVTTVRALFDGEVFRPEEPLDLRPDATYLVTIEGEAERTNDETAEDAYPLTAIGRLALDMGVTDLAEHHQRYARGRITDDRDGA